MLDAPTSEAWIDPWVAHLRAAGVDVHPRRRSGIHVSTAADPASRSDAAAETVTADHYVVAMPVEQVLLLVSPALHAAEPRLGKLHRLARGG